MVDGLIIRYWTHKAFRYMIENRSLLGIRKGKGNAFFLWGVGGVCVPRGLEKVRFDVLINSLTQFVASIS